MNSLEILSKKFLENFNSENSLQLLNFFQENKLNNLGFLFSQLLKKTKNKNILFSTAYFNYITEHYNEASILYNFLLNLPSLDHDDYTKIHKYYCQVIPHIKEKYSHYPLDIVSKLIKRKTREFPKITFTITTCKRFDLFQKTINSFLNCCLDISEIDLWLCIDDNSSKEDLEKMKELYPFFQFVLKDTQQKGHPISMNIIKNIVKTPYLLHMEDDWLFIRKEKYIEKCLNVLSEDERLGQCLFNKNYMETERDYDIVGGYIFKTNNYNNFYIHEFVPQGTEQYNYYLQKHANQKTCAYWPHFSFRPSIIRTEIFHKIGDFDTNCNHFEMEYAYRYVSKGYTSAFLPSIYCLHIGRLTSERNDSSKKNAYELNNEKQFVGKEKLYNIKTFVVNLDRREDRWKKFKEKNKIECERFGAVDGLKLKPSFQLQLLFNNNDYHYRRGLIGCALSHIQLWINLLNSNRHLNLILEDDVELSPNFNEKFTELCYQLENSKIEWDIVFISFHLYREMNKTGLVKMTKNESLIISPGGTGAYLITKRGAKKLLDFIDRVGMSNGIDTMMQKACDELNIYYYFPRLIKADYYDGTNQIDTDIQFDYNNLYVDTETRIKNEIEYYKQRGYEINCGQVLLTETNNREKFREEKTEFYHYDIGEKHVFSLHKNILEKCKEKIYDTKIKKNNVYTIEEILKN